MQIDAEFNADGTVRKPGQDYYLKPMNCPMHHLIYRSRGRSYRELPLRLFEFGSVYRYEKSGVIHGLTRVRGMTQDDAHIYTTREQMRDELTSLLGFVLDLLSDYGLDDFYLELSTRDPEKSVGSDELWEEATATLREVAEASGLDLVPDPGGAAFYGPKISVQVKDALGRHWQMSTIQLDFNMPDRFELEYTSADGSRQRPVLIHRALFGSIERFFGGAHRALRGRVPGVARAGTGGRGCPSRTSTSRIWKRLQQNSNRTASGSRWMPVTTGWPRRSSTTPTSGCRSCCWPGTPMWRQTRCPSGSATAASSTGGYPGRRPWRRSWTGSPGGRTRPPRCRSVQGGLVTDGIVDRGVGDPDHLQRLWTPRTG